eukprot:s1946_g5.t1
MRQTVNLSVPLQPMYAGETQPSVATMGDTQAKVVLRLLISKLQISFHISKGKPFLERRNAQVDSLTMELQSAVDGVFNQETQPGLPEVDGTPPQSEEDAQLAAMGWSIPKTCRPSGQLPPATPKVVQPAPATPVDPSQAAAGLPVPARVVPEGSQPANPGLPAPATVPKQGNGALPAPAMVLQESHAANGVTAPAMCPQQGHGALPAPATAVPERSQPANHGLPAPAMVPKQGNEALPAPATLVPERSQPANSGLPAPATVPSQSNEALPAPATVVPQQVAPATVVPQQAPATVVPELANAGTMPVPATVVPQLSPATVVPQQAPATVVPKQANAGTMPVPATVVSHVAQAGGLPAPATASPCAGSHAALPAAPAFPQQVHGHVPATRVVPKVPMMPPPQVVPHQAQAGFAVPATLHMPKTGMPAQPNKDEYSRRAAANLIKRLKENPSRVQAFLQVQEEVGRVNIARKKALRYTKKQMQDHYGEEAEAVMKFKEEQGLTDDDENNPNGKVYLISALEDETENYRRNCNLMSTSRMQVTPENANDVAEIMKPPPKPAAKRVQQGAPATPSTASSPGTPAPATPSESDEPKKKKPRKGAEEQTPLTALQKARDMCNKLLKKKNDAGTLTLTLQSLPYAEALSNEMQKFATQFEFFG